MYPFQNSTTITLKLHKTSNTHKNASYTYTWDKSGTITKIDQANQRHLYKLDKHKHIDKVVYPDGSFTACSYDELSRTYTEVTRGGNRKTKTYDAQKRLLEEKFNDEVLQSFSYEGKNPQPVRHSVKGKETLYRYDAQWHPTIVTTPDKQSKHYSYTAQGQLENIVDALGIMTLSYGYDDKGRVVKQTNALGLETSLGYDDYGKQTHSLNPRGEESRYGYDNKGALLFIRNDMGERIEFGYTQAGELESITDPAKRKTTFVYNLYGQHTDTLYPDNTKQSYSYNTDETLSHLTRKDESTLKLSYDSNKNIHTITAQEPQDLSRRAKEISLYYSHDILGNLLEASSSSHRLKRRYNDAGLLEKEMQDEYGIHYSYDSRGNLEGIQFLDFGYYYRYDDGNRLIEAKTHSNPLQKGIGFGYNANGLVEEINTPHNIKTLYTYDDASQLIEIAQQNIQTHTLTHKRDKLGRVQQIVDQSQEDPQEYSYDQRGALIEEMQGSSVQQYHYDSAGNRVDAPLQAQTKRYNTANQLIEDSLYLYSYDSRGNLHTKEDKHTQTWECK